MTVLPGQLVGRAAELAAAEAALAGLDEGSPRLLAVPGDAGMGKTRLLGELRGAAEARDHLVLSGRAAEFERDLPFALWVDALDDHLATLEIDDPKELGGAAVLAEAAGILPSLRPVAADAALPPLGDERHRAHNAIRRLVERLASERPLVLLLDDLHWADAGSLELLASLVRRPPAAPVLLALAYRPRQVSERLAAGIDRAEREGGLARLALDPLTRDEVNELLGPNVRPATLELLHAECGGNPFYLEQLARAGVTDPTTPATDDARELAGVPRAVTSALADELRALSQETRLVLDAASVVGDPFEPDLAATVAELPEPAVLVALDDLVAADVVRPTDVPRRFAFRHPLVRRAVYESTRSGWRLAAHARAAVALAERGGPAGVRAHHVEQSARPGDVDAVELLQAAGEEAAARAPATAVRWFQGALRLIPAGEEHRDRRAGLLLSLAKALATAGRFDEARGTLLELIDSLPEDAVRQRVALTSYCAGVEHLIGRHVDANARLVEALEGLPDRDTAEALSLMLELATDAFYRAAFDEMESWSAEALAAARAQDSRPHAAAAAALLALAYTLTGRIEDAQAQVDEAAALVDALADDELAVRLDAAVQLGWSELYLERWDPAVAHTRRGIEVARATGQGQFISMMAQAQGVALVGVGDVSEAMRLLSGAVDAARLTDNRQLLSLALRNYALGAWVDGELEAGLRAAEESVELARQLDNSLMSAFAGGTLGLLMAESPQAVADAPQVLREYCGGPELPLIPATWRPTFLEPLVRGELAAGRVEEAASAADAATEVAGRIGLNLATAHAKRCQAAVALARGEARAAADLALEAVAAAEGIPGGGAAAARARTLAGRALADLGEREQAIEHLEAAAAELERRGTVRFRDAVVHELRRLGRRPRHQPAPGSGADGIASLSKREREIAELVADRRMNKEIAAELFLSEKTVESHLRNVFAKLGVSSRVEVARVIERERRAAG